MKRQIILTENDIHDIVENALNSILKEDYVNDL